MKRSRPEPPEPEPPAGMMPRSVELLRLIRSKPEWNWKPSEAEQAAGFRGWHQRGYLPHFDAPVVTQIVTRTLADAIPRRLWDGISRSGPATLNALPSSIQSARRRLEALLDTSRGQCHLRNPEIASCVESSLCRGDSSEYQLGGWVIMPNHVHLVVDIWERPLSELVQAWKGKSAREANRVLRRTGRFWREDYYDTLVRDERHLARAVRYIEDNPVNARMVACARDWPWSSARFRDEYERLPTSSGRFSAIGKR